MSDQLTDTSLDPEINSSPVDLSRALHPGGEGYIKRKMQVYVCVCVLGHFSCVQLFATLRTVVRQAPLSMGFSRQEYWSGLPCPPVGSSRPRDQTFIS